MGFLCILIAALQDTSGRRYWTCAGTAWRDIWRTTRGITWNLPGTRYTWRWSLCEFTLTWPKTRRYWPTRLRRLFQERNGKRSTRNSWPTHCSPPPTYWGENFYFFFLKFFSSNPSKIRNATYNIISIVVNKHGYSSNSNRNYTYYFRFRSVLIIISSCKNIFPTSSLWYLIGGYSRRDSPGRLGVRCLSLDRSLEY